MISILGMNRRNIDYIYIYNERKNYKFADDKLISKMLLEKHGIPTPRLIKAYNYFYELHKIVDDLHDLSDFVIKPAHGMGGGGILVFDKFENNNWHTTSGEIFDADRLYQHATMILSGVYSLDNTNDSVMVEEKIQLDDLLEQITYKGIPDIRVIVFKKQPVMAMIRIPTKQSDGKANLHAGGIGVAIDMETGLTKINKTNQTCPEFHPDTNEPLQEIQIPHWQEIIHISRHVQDVVPLMYLGIDFVIDRRYGPQVLELNVRPGLEIQNINGQGLNHILQKVGASDE